MNPVESSESNRKKISRDSISGRSAAWLARLLWEQEVEGSNPFAPTCYSLFLRNFRSLNVQATAVIFSFSAIELTHQIERLRREPRSFWRGNVTQDRIRKNDHQKNSWQVGSRWHPLAFLAGAPPEDSGNGWAGQDQAGIPANRLQKASIQERVHGARCAAARTMQIR